MLRGSPEDLAQQVLRELAVAGWQSDERFAGTFVASKTERGYGPLVIIAELKQRGIDAEIIAGSIRTGDPCWEERMLQARARHFGTRVPVDRKERARQARYLVNRGFISERVRRALDTDD
ncbi:MAG: regulatory protein RecX [Gammaproteobacteria bacterium]|nr:regulatory protein RecX [Gammaproteobacteria bacterium]